MSLNSVFSDDTPAICIQEIPLESYNGFTFNDEIILFIIKIRRRTFIKRHKSRNIHSEALYMSKYTQNMYKKSNSNK